MGRSRRGQHHSQFDNPLWEERYHPSSRTNEPLPQFQSPQGPRDNFSETNNPSERNQHPRNPHWTNSQRYNPAHPNPMQSPSHFDQAFITKSKRLKEYLVRSLNAALSQIEQWYPEASEDAMDWQHEEEIVVPPPKEASYVWDPPSQGTGQSPPKNTEDDVPTRFSASEGLRAAGFGGGKQWGPEADCKNDFFGKERNPVPDLSSPLEMNSGIF